MRVDFLKKNNDSITRCAIFMSGSGTNAVKLLEYIQQHNIVSWKVVCIVSDRPETSSAREIASKYGIDIVEHPIGSFYRAHGLDKVSIATKRGMEVREMWTDELRKKLAAYKIDFAVFAGFVPLTNIVNDFPCLNVHPGDLTLENSDGTRLLTGLHHIPVETAIMRGHTSLRSSVILVQSVTQGGSETDTGFILGISQSVPMTISEEQRNKIETAYAERKGKKRSDYGRDELAVLAEKYQNILKEHGDWIVLPQTVADFAEGRFSADCKGQLMRDGIKIKTCIYSKDSEPEIIRV